MSAQRMPDRVGLAKTLASVRWCFVLMYIQYHIMVLKSKGSYV